MRCFIGLIKNFSLYLFLSFEPNQSSSSVIRKNYIYKYLTISENQKTSDTPNKYTPNIWLARGGAYFLIHKKYG